ncbi:hypothetical protein C8T65DRAFT_737670 [Cerioporus squamosus]|nr:hypothetical protein C8T65DRAFT_737670 [Cerioporus squamosus]
MPGTYHPTLNEAVELAWAVNITVVIFPTLIRLDRQTVRWRAWRASEGSEDSEDSTGKDSTGKDSTGKDSTGKDSMGEDSKDKDSEMQKGRKGKRRSHILHCGSGCKRQKTKVAEVMRVLKEVRKDQKRIMKDQKKILAVLEKEGEHLDLKMYHPTLNDAIEAAYARNIKLTVFPTLLHVKQFKDLEAIVKWLLDLSEVHADPCKPCKDAGWECMPHNGNSIRCLHCFLKDAPSCTHQTRMVELGHAAAPRCMPYTEASNHDLTPVPASFEWKLKRRKTTDKKDRAKDGDVGAKVDEELGEDIGKWAVTVAAADGKDSGEEVVDELVDEQVDKPVDDDVPMVGTKRKAPKPRKAASRKKANSNNTGLLKDIQSLLQELVQTNTQLLDLKLRYYNLSSSSGSVDEANYKCTEHQTIRSLTVVAALRTDRQQSASAGPSKVTTGAAVEEGVVAGPSRAVS